MAIDAHAHLAGDFDWAALEALVESGRFEQVWLMDLSPCELRMPGFPDVASATQIMGVVERFPDVVVPFGYLDLREGPEIVARRRDEGFVGLKLYRPEHPCDDPRYFDHYAQAEELGMPILMHTGLLAKVARGDMAAGLSHGPENMRPSRLAAIAEAFPNLTLIGGHLGYPWLEETAANLYYHANVYNDLSGYRKDIEWLIRNLDRKCHDGTKRYFNHKILFATDTFYGSADANEEALKLLTFWELFLECVGGYYYRWGEPEEREKILRGNAAGIFVEKDGG